MNRTREKVTTPQDDALQISGWVFADLLLSLAIIFLVSISFAIPEKIGASPKVNVEVPAQNTVDLTSSDMRAPISQGINFYYSEFNREEILDDLRRYFERENLDPRTDVIYAQVVGGFDPLAEGSEQGTFRALEFSIALKKAEVQAFAKANFDLTTSSQLAPGQVALRLSFVPPITK